MGWRAKSRPSFGFADSSRPSPTVVRVFFGRFGGIGRQFRHRIAVVWARRVCVVHGIVGRAGGRFLGEHSTRPPSTGYGRVPVGKRLILGGSRARTWIRLRALVLALSLGGATVGAGVVGAGVVGPAAASSSGGGSSTIAALEQRIAADGVAAKQLVTRYDKDEAREAAIKRQLVKVSRELVRGRAAKAMLARRLRQIAIESYVNSDSSGAVADVLDVPSDLSSVAAVYTEVATNELSTTATGYEADEYLVTEDQTRLRNEQRAVEATLRALLPDRVAAEAAVARDEALLQNARGDVRTALAADTKKDAAIDAAAEDKLANQKIPVSASSLDPVPTPTATPSSGPSGYVNPLRGVAALYPERIDQGVDYAGYGPIYALGDGTVLSTVNGGWPGGTYITYRLSDGPAAGLVVYAAEDIEPLVQAGESVTPNTVLGTVYEGPDGIETGWADNGTGDTMARDASQFYGWNSTAFGANFSELLVSLGAPGGVPQNDPFTGVVPSDWPTW